MTTAPPTPEKPSPEALEAAYDVMSEIFFDNDEHPSWSGRTQFAIALALDRFAAALVEAERERCFRWAIGRVPRSRAAQAIRDGDNPDGTQRDPSVCWRCGTPLHPGHFCGERP